MRMLKRLVAVSAAIMFLAAGGAAFAGLGQGGGSLFTGVAAALLYGGFVSPR